MFAALTGAGLSAAAGVDAVLRRRFAEAGKPIMGLETAQGQLALFDALAPADQQAMLERSIDDFDRAAADYRTMLDDWAAGDGDGLLDRVARGILARPAVRQALLDGRPLITPEQVQRARLWAWFYRSGADVPSGVRVYPVGMLPEQCFEIGHTR